MRGDEGPQTVVWRSWKPRGWEFCTVRGEGTGRLARGTIVRESPKGVGTVVYKITLGRDWETKTVGLEQVVGGVRSEVKAETEEGRWRIDGKVRSDLQGCIDVDLGASPLTNTFPIKRMKPRVGEIMDLTVAWVRFPSLEVARTEQSYERTSDHGYIYRSRTGFRAHLRFDEFGLVSKYGDYWSAV